jgi:hypothetical protein
MRSLDETAPHFSCIAGSIFYVYCLYPAGKYTGRDVENTTVVNEETISPEQQAAIDAIDKPVLDEKIQMFRLKLPMHLQMPRL